MFCYYFWAFDQETYGFSIPEHLFGPLYYACTPIQNIRHASSLSILRLGFDNFQWKKLLVPRVGEFLVRSQNVECYTWAYLRLRTNPYCGLCNTQACEKKTTYI